MKRLGIIFGGKSDEHEISILSASSVISAIDKSKYEVVQIGINRDGHWYLITDKMDDIVSLDDDRVTSLIPSGTTNQPGAEKLNIGSLKDTVDFVFPVLHGPYGEDGTIQGMFEMLDIPYAGCGVTSSALAMDKVFAKELWIRENLPVCKHKSITAFDFEEHEEDILRDIESNLNYPLFIKPANLGSSVGISRADDNKQLINSITYALKYDNRILVEEEIKGRELETAVLGNNSIRGAAVGEIVSAGEFYDYESKYKDGATKLYVPAGISDDKKEEITELAIKAFKTLGGSGYARIDFFLEDSTNKIYLNEMNTIPGFTKFSMFPTLWNEAGVEYKELIERIIELGYERYNAKNNR